MMGSAGQAQRSHEFDGGITCSVVIDASSNAFRMLSMALGQPEAAPARSFATPEPVNESARPADLKAA